MVWFGGAVLFLTTWSLAAGQHLPRGISKLAFNIGHQLERSSANNFVFSPYSAHSAFSQVLLGSKGNSQRELESVLGIQPGDTVDYQDVRDKLLTSSGNSKLNVANILALVKGFKPKTTFTNQVISRFQSKIRELDLANKDASVRQINNLVSSITNNKITELLNPTQIDSLTKLILINAIYFKAPWKTTFDKSESFQAEFKTASGARVETNFMTGRLNVRLLNDVNNKVMIVELPYTDVNKAMLLVLPTDGDSSNLVDRLKNIDLNTVRDQPASETIVSLPTFKIRKRIDLKKEMLNLGVTNIFSSNADLTNIADDGLYVSDAIQDAYIEVNEEGTEAAAATAVSIGVRTSQRTRQFFADEPFLFIIYDFATRMPLFFGKMNTPADSGLAARSGLGSSSVPAVPVNNGPFIQAVPASTSSPVATVQQPAADCSKYLADFPNAVENVRLCRDAEKLKLFDWLRAARATCEQSNKLTGKFYAGNCGPAWCTKTVGKKPKWEADERSKCSTEELKSANLSVCKTIKNHLAAHESLNCDNL